MKCCFVFYGIMKDMNALFGMVDHRTVEAMAMRWLKRDLWKAGIVIASMLLLLVLMVWVPASAADTHERISEFAGPVTVTVQTTPTEDATVTALNKEKLEQEIQQLKYQNEQIKNQNAPDFFVWLPGWLRTNSAILLSTLVVVIGGLIGLFRWFGDRRSERDKRAEERFQAAVTGLGDEKEGAKIGAAILLRTFLRPGYEQFYTQTFDLAVANLRLPRTPKQPADPNTPLLPTTLQQALIVVFKEAFPRAREWEEKQRKKQLPFHQRITARLPWLKGREQEVDHRQYLDASFIQLDKAFLFQADLKQAWMPLASLREADLGGANLSEAKLSQADLSWARLDNKAILIGANLSGAKLNDADLSGADLSGTNLGIPDLSKADQQGSNRDGADLCRTNLAGAKLWGAKLRDAKNFEEAIFKKDGLSADLHGAFLTDKQRDFCQKEGVIIDEVPTTSSFQQPVTPPPSSQSNDTQVS